MNLVSLKNPSDAAECIESYQPELYGYGLRICLNDAQCAALGLTKALAAGALVTITAKAVVVSSTESVGTENGNNVRVELQITDMGVDVGGVLKNAAQTLYGEDK